MLREVLWESHFVLFYLWTFITFCESRFLLFWKKHLTIITISLNYLSIPPIRVCRKISTPLCFLPLDVGPFWVRFSAYSFFSFSCRTSTLPTFSLSSLACFSPAFSPVLGFSGLDSGSFSTLFGSAERNSVWNFSFNVATGKDCSEQILKCPFQDFFRCECFQSKCVLICRFQPYW